MKTPKLSPQEALDQCRMAYGPRVDTRSATNITSANRNHVKAWLCSEGVASSFVSTMSLDSLRNAYADTTNATLQAMRSMARNAPSDLLDTDTDSDGESEAPAQQAAPINPADADMAARKLAEAMAAFASLNTGNAKLDEKRVREIVAEHMHIHRDEVQTMLNEAGLRPLVIELRREGDLVGRIEGVTHPKFAQLLKAATARDANGYAPNIWISGPAGSGKTRAVQDACKALQLGFEHNGALAMPHELVGFIDAAGKYHETAFYRAYGKACGYLFDEVDASDNAALMALNAALANGHASFPCGAVERHQDNRIFVAANTWGMGATADFVGRAKLDAAFLDRFPVKIHFDYDEEMERAICGNADWARQVQAARAKARACGLKVAITPRASIGGAALLAAGFSNTEAAELTYLASLTADQRRQIAA